MTDCDFIVAVLEQGPATLNTLLRRSFAERGHGLTVHSRVAELRPRGYVIDCDPVPGRKRGDGWVYTLVAKPVPAPSSEPPSASPIGGSDGAGGLSAQSAGGGSLPREPVGCAEGEQLSLEAAA